MANRQSISLSEPNAEWLKFQVESQEYASNSEVINDLIRQRRKQENEELTRTRALLIQAEQRLSSEGYSNLSVEDIKNAVLKNKV
ncbi:MAG TPA: CopG family transcriptional regulator [Alteromonas sp.]|nr:CopG family transcriptional regulator [Alteromonas sp.]HCB16061.1 CopG family transcriptional regulator [Alteromonas sp.]|tara:strand:+ start:7920 stop:8174 length:255 start_codon:yes stop_codon:yes gene_type:complete